MSQTQSNMNPDDETLLAYLDDDLPDEELHRIRQQLSHDPELRRRVDELRVSWDMLDDLPESLSNPKLAESTIELVAVRVMEERTGTLTGKFMAYRWPLIITTTFLALLFGAWAAVRRYHGHVEELVAGLPLLTRYSEINLIDSPEWLERLAQLDRLIEAGLPLHRAVRTVEFKTLPDNRSQLTAWRDSLEVDQRHQLSENLQSFQSASDERKNELRKVDEIVRNAGQVDYSQILKAYTGLISQIQSTELAQIGSIQDLNERAAWVQKIIYRELAIGYANSLTDQEQMGIRAWAGELKEKNFEYFLPIEAPDSEIILMLDSSANPQSIIEPEDVADLMNRLGAKARELLSHLDESQRSTALSLWVHEALPTTRPQPQLTSEQLQQQFRSLPLERQNALIYQPSSEVIKALTDEDEDD